MAEVLLKQMEEFRRAEDPASLGGEAGHLHKARLREELVDLLRRIARCVEGAHDGAGTGASDDLGA